MNFIGHSLVASWVDHEPRFVLGAMLPDLATMAGQRRVEATDAAVIAGVAWHHRTDTAFHGCSSFLALTDAGRVALAEAGVGRGAAMAVAHIGVELLLDGELCHDAAVVAHYRSALASDAALDPPLRAVVDRLAQAPTPHWYRDPGEVTLRLVRILGGRPRLAIAPREIEPIARWLETSRHGLREAIPQLLTEIRDRLAL